MDERGGLENRCGLRATVGSNPTLSASTKAGLVNNLVFLFNTQDVELCCETTILQIT